MHKGGFGVGGEWVEEEEGGGCDCCYEDGAAGADGDVFVPISNRGLVDEAG